MAIIMEICTPSGVLVVSERDKINTDELNRRYCMEFFESKPYGGKLMLAEACGKFLVQTYSGFSGRIEKIYITDKNNG